MVLKRHGMCTALLVVAVAVGQQCLIRAADDGMNVFEPKAGVASAAALVAPGIKKANIIGVTVVSSKLEVLLQAPPKLSLYLSKDVTVTATQRADLTETDPGNIGPKAKASFGDKVSADKGLYDGATMWVGEVEGFEGGLSAVALATDGKTTSGIVRWVDFNTSKAHSFQVDPVEGGKMTAITEFTEVQEGRKALIPDFKPGKGQGKVVALPTEPADQVKGKTANGTLSGGSRRLLRKSNSVATVMDILLVMTSNAKRKHGGGFAGVSRSMRTSVALANKAYRDSGISAKLRIVGIKEVSYNDNKNGAVLISDLQAGLVPNVLAWRNETKADLVSLYTVSPGCGLGYSNGPVTGYQNHAFSLVQKGCLGASYTLAHEVGHNMGCGHNKDDRNNPYQNWAVGYRQCSKNKFQFKTIMSYYCGNQRTPEVGMFANPSKTVKECEKCPKYKTGSNTEKCALAMRVTAPVVAAYSDVMFPPTPSPP